MRYHTDKNGREVNGCKYLLSDTGRRYELFDTGEIVPGDNGDQIWLWDENNKIVRGDPKRLTCVGWYDLRTIHTMPVVMAFVWVIGTIFVVVNLAEMATDMFWGIVAFWLGLAWVAFLYWYTSKCIRDL